MASNQPRLVLLYNADARLTDGLSAFQQIGSVERANDFADIDDSTPPDQTLVVVPLDRVPPAAREGLIERADLVLSHLGDGVGVVDDQDHLVWHDDRLGSYDETTRQRLIERCQYAFERFNSASQRNIAPNTRPSIRLAFNADPAHYEIVVSPATTDPADPQRVNRVVAVLWEVTASRRLQAKIDAIDAAGSELMNIKATTFSGRSMGDRLQLLEKRIVKVVHELLNFDNFEIRLLNHDTNQLELVIQIGLTPLKIGEMIYAEQDGNGISGYVAATGEAYLCPDVTKDPLYREGLDDPGSALTVPLRLHDQTIGTFNVESSRPNQFDENDLQFAEIFGRYIAAAMNILDLLIVERYTTNEQVMQNMIGELTDPLNDITARAIAIQSELDASDDSIGPALDGIVRSTESMRRRIEALTSGPRSILGAENELEDECDVDPQLSGKRVLIADDEPVIRDTLARMLSRRGCTVLTCKDGIEAVKALEETNEERPYDLVISDIRMPGHTGYEVFRASKTASERTRVILMTGFGYDPAHSIVRATQEGLNAFLFKPFKAQQMIDAVTDALNGK
ncbi:MAG: response regulator [Planctomycetota bacterium]